MLASTDVTGIVSLKLGYLDPNPTLVSRTKKTLWRLLYSIHIFLLARRKDTMASNYQCASNCLKNKQRKRYQNAIKLLQNIVPLRFIQLYLPLFLK